MSRERINSGEKMEGEDLRDIDFAGRIDRPALLYRADLQRAKFDRCTGEQAKHFDCREKKLQGATFVGRDCRGIHLNGVVFDRSTDFTGATMWQHDYDAADPAEWAKVPVAKRPIVLPSPEPPKGGP